MHSRKVVNQSRESYRKDENELKVLRLSIESLKNETIDKLDNMNVKSPRNWRDNLINFRIRRKILNRESSLTVE
jgi:hypothetical protein